MTSSTNSPNFLPNILDWTVIRRDRTFRVYVVEPGRYEPTNHADIFNAAINFFIERRPEQLDQYVRDTSIEPPPRFDLVTFPEAFLPAQQLIDVLNYIGRTESFGCVHVGLRPSASDPNHLFKVAELKALISELKKIRTSSQRILPSLKNGSAVRIDAPDLILAACSPWTQAAWCVFASTQNLSNRSTKSVRSKSRIWKKPTF